MDIIKKNWLVILIFILVMIPFWKYFISYNKNLKVMETREQAVIKDCQTEEGYNVKPSYCDEVLEFKNIKIDFLTMMTDMLVFGISFINPLAFAILVFPTLCNTCKILKNKYIINSLTRQDYKDFKKAYFKNAYKYFWLLPLIALIIIFGCIFITTFDNSYAIKYGTAMWEDYVIKYQILFILGYVLNIMMYSFFFINLSLIVVRKVHKIILAFIISSLTYVGIELFFELLLKPLIYKLFNSDIGHLFNIMNLFTFSDMFGSVKLLLFTFSMLFLSSMGVYLAYRNKEKLVIDCESNN